jgi:predicted ester cyclase
MWRITEEIWNQAHVERIDQLIAEELVDHVDLAGLEGRGRARYRASIELMRAAFPDYQNALDFVLGDGAFAVSYGRATRTHAGDFMGIPPSGRSFDVPTFGILRFDDGRAVERVGDGRLLDDDAAAGHLGLTTRPITHPPQKKSWPG